jgi:hypothetical protein
MTEIRLVNDTDFQFTIQVFATTFKYNKEYYMVTPNLGLKIDYIEYDDNIYRDFIYGHWSGLIIFKLNDIPKKYFTYLVKSHIDHSTITFIDDNRTKYIEEEYFPINMIPTNPSNLYYKVESDIQDCGKPFYNKNKLYGIVSKCESDYVYVIPSIYIIRTLEKKSNDILISNTKNIKKINKYKVYDNIVYSKELRKNIRLDSYLILISDINTQINYNDLDIYINFKNVKKSYYKNTYILHYCKIFNEELLMEIYNNFNTCHKKINIEINGIKKTFVY